MFGHRHTHACTQCKIISRKTSDIPGQSRDVSEYLNHGLYIGISAMFAQVFVARWYGISRCFHGDKGNVSGSQEFRPGKVLSDKQNDKVSGLAGALPSLFHPTNVCSSLQSRFLSASPPSSIFLPLHYLIPHPAIYICKCHLFHPSLFPIH